MRVELVHGSEFAIWPGVAPGSESLSLTEQIEERSADPDVPDRAVTGISVPTLTAFIPDNPTEAAMLVVPGGGYVRESLDNEGYTFARWLNSFGIAAFVLKYRLPSEGHANGADVPLQDGQRAMRVIRHNASRWGIRPASIGAIGSSAGGHLVASLATQFDRDTYAARDACDDISARPDAVVLMYSVISMEQDWAHPGSRRALLGEAPSPQLVADHSCEYRVRSDMPPVFLSHAHDDASVSPQNAIRFYSALLLAGVRAEMHVFESGGHGHGITYATGPAKLWTSLCEPWLARHLF